MKKNHAFDFFKVLFMIVIILHHSLLLDKWLVRGYIMVEFFFIISGYLLFQTYKRNTDLTVVQYFKRRISKLYPYYFAAFILLSIFYTLLKKGLPYKSILNGILELFMLQNTIIPGGGGINYPLWYMSVLITASVLIYALLRVIPVKKFNYLALIVIVCVYTYLMRKSNIEQWNCVFIFYLPWWRGAADMLIGIVLHQVVDYFRAKQIKSFIYGAMEIICFAGIMILLFVNGAYDYLTVLFIIGLIFAVSLKSFVFDYIGKSNIIHYLSKYEYVAYVNHVLIIAIIDKVCEILNAPLMLHIILLMLGTLIFSILFKMVVDKGLQFLKNENPFLGE